MLQTRLNFNKIAVILVISLLTAAATPFFFSPALEYVSPVDSYLNGKFPTTLSSDLEWADYDATGISGALTARKIPGTNTMAFASINGSINFYDFDSNTLSDIVWDIAPTEGFTSSNGRYGLKGLAFHPEFGDLSSSNRNFVYISVLTNEDTRKVSKYTIDEETGILDANSELVMIELLGPNNSYHSVGELAFGGDGFLYIPFGDGSGGSSTGGSDAVISIVENYVQNIEGNLIGGVLRIDVDEDLSKSHPPIKKLPQTFEGETSGVGYFIPNDNPWVSPEGDNMEEYYTLGHRNPWKLTVDELTGEVWVSEVGPWNGEEVNLLQNGHNYGWPYRTGSTGEIVWDRREPTEPMPDPFLGTLTEPVFSPERSEASNSYLGAVYRGAKWPDYYGKVMFADISKRNAWMVGYDKETDENDIDELPNVDRCYIFFESPLGDIMTMTTGGVLKVLQSSEVNVADFPSLLSETGAFTTLNPLVGSTSLIPYTVNTKFWSDRAEKERWVVLPNDGVFDSADEQITFKSDSPWEFPEGTVFIKHFALALDEQSPDVLKPLETRFMIVGENGGTYGVTYKWLEDGSDALLTIEGATEDYVITADDGSNYTQTWEYPSSSECVNCHNANAGQSLGINTQQLNGDYTYHVSGVTDNQLNTLNDLNIFDTDIGDASQYIQNVSLDDASASNELKVRSYLDANCAYCHMPGGVDAAFDARITTPLVDQGLINELVASAGSKNSMVIVPGDIDTSELYLRDNSNGADAMPPLGRTMVDEEYIKVLEAWVYGLAGVTEDNIALGKATQQSTTAFSGASSRAVDGNRDGIWSSKSVTHTAKRANSWWRVDLGANYAVSAIKVFNRTNCCATRLESAKVYVSTVDSFDLEYYQEIGTLDETSEQNFYNLEAEGRYIMIYQEKNEYLSLAEVEAYGTIIETNEDNAIGEVGTVDINTNYTTVTFENTYENPVVIAGGASYNGSDAVTVRIDNLKATSFDIRLDEWSCYDGTHDSETVPYLVVEAGTYRMSNGKLLQAGNFEKESGSSFSNINYPYVFDEEPVAFAQAVSEREEETMNMRIHEDTSDETMLSVRMQEKDGDGSGHIGELISWIAMESGSGTNYDAIFEVGATPNEVTEEWYTINLEDDYSTTPLFIGEMGSYYGNNASALRYNNLTSNSVQVFVQEEKCGDNETRHTGEENVNYAVFQKAGTIFGEQVLGGSELSGRLSSYLPASTAIIDDFKIYPNPINQGDTVSFQWSSDEDIAAEIKVINLNGMLVDYFSLQTQIGPNVYTYHSATLSPGVYIIQLIENGKEPVYQRLVVN